MYQEIVIPTLISFAISVALGPIMIPFLRKLKVGQTVRDEGPESHLKKNGTPTMGGLLILTAMTVTSLFFIKSYPKIIPILFLTLGFGLIGFLDDYIKVVLKRSMGLRAWQKFALQLIVTGVFAYYLCAYTDVSLAFRIPFASGQYIDFGIFNIPLLFFVVLGTVNGTNFTDGLDGLATSVTILVATFFTACAIGLGAPITPVTCAAVGALLGFLLFNGYPASVFMGDTGSLALGGALASLALLTGTEFLLVLVGGIFVIEALSVIIQVSYFKLTNGKRIFKMSPIHHHFELSGLHEVQVTARFTIISVILALLGVLYCLGGL